ncbi:ABC transporter ATP-binding protein [Legionella parisiensis]|uniref:Putative ABC transporter ATP-binding protein YbhF n=1 Tax=Legionella parisiensis TaxID=45071 RepID=A0A1E5JQ69_9GAMM|nr:ABC transporter ATP-binding protein [Legionella parisiensis]KTD39950.1 ABC transporter ATP-binding protein [Legionella parisiensis]OEH46188.1 putative ABC transporter ATP-binding protein YbhF [Legionella parisiensis]STX77506.1 ABC transporter ATP-binding protein [Legionella parisiensis]
MDKSNYIIDVRHLAKKFNKNYAVNDLELKVEYGDIFGFIGPNGAGKTTSIRMLCGLITPDSGIGQCVGFDILTESRQIKTLVGYMSQNFGLYKDLTVYENMLFFAEIYGVLDRKNQIEKYLHKFDLYKHKHQIAGTLSGGWKQRLSLAVSLLHDPLLLLLDEPTANIDPKARREFWELMHQLSREGITILLSSHNLDEVDKCDKIAYMYYGRTLLSGTIEEILRTVNLTTWAIKGVNLPMLAHQLEATEGVDQVLRFHNTLHVSGKNREVLSQAIKPYINNDFFHGNEIDSTLEDAFVWLATFGAQRL